MIKKVLGLVVAIVAIFLVYVALQPAEFRVSRELVVNASVDKVFPFINNSVKMNEWMPWLETDPDVKMIYSGPEEGVGSKSEWNSDGRMGTGQAVIIESITNQSVKTQLTYTRPMEMSQTAELFLSVEGEGTLVKWSVTGTNNFVGRLMSLFIDMDKMIGTEFEKGLSKLKKIVEVQK